MKLKVIFSITIGFLMSVSLSLATANNHKIDKVHSELMSYVYKKMGNNTMIRENSIHLDCFNEFIPLINFLASNARDVSNYCVSDASKQKDEFLSKLKSERKLIESEVEKITKSMVECSEKEGLNYFQCHADNTERNRQLMETIKEKSREIMEKYAEKSAEIEQDEQICLMNAIEMARLASDRAFSDLKSCLNGGPAIQAIIE